MVQRDWIKLATSREMANKPPSEIFECMLVFLEDTKRQAEYFGTEVRQTGANQAKASTKLGFVNCGPTDSLVTNTDSHKVREPPRQREPLPCLACADGSTDLETTLHPTNSCNVWRNLTYQKKKSKSQVCVSSSQGP